MGGGDVGDDGGGGGGGGRTEEEFGEIVPALTSLNCRLLLVPEV